MERIKNDKECNIKTIMFVRVPGMYDYATAFVQELWVCSSTSVTFRPIIGFLRLVTVLSPFSVLKFKQKLNGKRVIVTSSGP